MLALIIIVVLVLWIFVSCIKIVPQAQAYVIERLGAYQATWNVGFNLKIPFVDKVARKVNLKRSVPLSAIIFHSQSNLLFFFP